MGASVITMGGEKQVDQEMVNAYKAAMMYRAMQRFKELQPKLIESKIALFQREEMQKHRSKVQLEMVKKSRRSDDDFEILCKRCNTFACHLSDVRKRGHDHLVADKGFALRINTKPHGAPVKYDGIEKKAKMFCKKCPSDWGIVAEKDGIDIRILKIKMFKFRNMRTQDITNYNKWIDVPYRVPDIDDEDLAHLVDVE